MLCRTCRTPITDELKPCPVCSSAPGAAHRAAQRHRAPSRARFGDSLGALGFLAPNIIGFLAFTAIPIVAAFLLSFVRWDAIESWQGIRWVGTENYAHILGFHHEGARLVANDDGFWSYLYNTAFLMLGIPIGMALSLLTALLLNQKLRGIVFFRTLFFLPTVCSAVAVAVLWRWIYDADQGLLNILLRGAGVTNPPDWLGDTAWAKPALILMGLWTGVGGYNCILYLAGLQGVSVELYEAAELDGAGSLQKLLYITWPSLAPTTFFILIMSIISGFQGHFVAIHILTGGGPAGATTNLLYYIYENAFSWHNMGYACALAMVLFALVFIFTLANFKVARRATQPI
jgi:multiple sugar transport system permease protein